MSEHRDPARQGAQFLARRKPAQAMAALRLALTAHPTDHASLLLLGRAHLMAADAFGAVVVLEQLCRDAPDFPEAAEALAAAYRRDARYGDVLELVAAQASPSVQMLYERAMAQAALGEAAAALASFDAALAGKEDLAAAWFGSHGPALDLLGWGEAERRLQRAIGCSGANRKYQAFLAAYDRLRDAPLRDCPQSHRHLAEGVAAVRPAMAADCRLFGVSGSLLRWALAQATRPGLVLEFGVRRGTSITLLGQQAGQPVHGFDSFEGLPESWSNTPSGVLTTGRSLPPVPANVRLHAGWFDDTLPGFFAAHPGPLRFANIDSDIYSSARTALWAMADRVGPGTILVFDEFIGNRSWRDDEYRAFHEFVAEFALPWRIIAVGLLTKQVAIEIL